MLKSKISDDKLTAYIEGNADEKVNEGENNE